MNLAIHDGSDEFLVVDIALRIFMPGQQLLHLFVCQFLTQSCQKVTQLCGGNVTISILVKMTQAFDKVLCSVVILCL